MAIYTKADRKVKDRPPMGMWTTRIRREMPMKDGKDLHSFILEDDNSMMFWNVYLNELDSIARTLGVEPDPDGSIDTAKFVGQWITVKVGEKYTKSGKPFQTVLDYYKAKEPAEVTAAKQALGMTGADTTPAF